MCVINSTEENMLIPPTLFLGLAHISCLLPIYKHGLLMTPWAKVLTHLSLSNLSSIL